MGLKYKWKEEYALSIENIDIAHRQILDCMNLCSTLIKNHENEKVTQVVEALKEYSLSHFADEEIYMREHQYADIDQHIKYHNEFILNLKQIDLMIKKNDFISLSEILIFLNKWFLNHIQIEDRKYI